MPKVWCAAVDCVHNEGNQCHADEINLRDGEVNTIFQGKLRYQQCRTLQQDEEIKRMFRELADALGTGILRREEG